MDVLILGAQEQASSAAAPMLIAFAIKFIIATQKTTPHTARCDVVKSGIVYRNQLFARLYHVCLSGVL